MKAWLRIAIVGVLFLLACGEPSTVFLSDGDADLPESPDGDLEDDEETERDADPAPDGDFEPPDPCEPNPCTAPRQRVCVPGPEGAALCLCDPGYVPNAGRCEADPDNSGQTCYTPRPLRPGAPQAGTTDGAESHHNASCTHTWPTGPETVYSLVLDEPTYVFFTLESPDGFVHVRRLCADADSEVLCLKKATRGAVRGGGVLDAGEYAVIVDSFYSGAPYTLTVTTRSDPCAGLVCPSEAPCSPLPDWSRGACRCPEGMIWADERCLPDPCTPNPCITPGRTVCRIDDAGKAQCHCAPTHVDTGYGWCAPDPANNQWLIMIYLNADNSLESAGYTDLAEMAAADYAPGVHVVVLFDSYRRDSGATKRLYLGPHGIEVLDILPEADMSDGETLADFGVWALSHYPAQRVALILWDHGTGWAKRSGASEGGYKGFSSDNTGGGGEISIASGEYGRALARIVEARGVPLDLVGFDACYMGMWEVALATEPYADYLVASMDQEPNGGWRYDAILSPLAKNPREAARSLGERIVRVYREESDANDTLALVDLKELPPLTEALNRLATALMAHPEHYDRVESLRLQAQSVFLFDTYRDLRHAAQLLAADPALPQAVRLAAEELDTHTATALTVTHIHPRKANAHGLTLYFPSRNGWVHPDYLIPEAPWSGASDWGAFLLDFAGLPY